MSKIRYSSRTKIIEDSAIFDQLINDNCLSTDGKIVLLTKDNARIVEELIKNDDDYFPFSQTLFEHYGINKIQHNAEKSLFAVAREIDRDNSNYFFFFLSRALLIFHFRKINKHKNSPAISEAM